jgi:hypothetical protein
VPPVGPHLIQGHLAMQPHTIRRKAPRCREVRACTFGSNLRRTSRELRERIVHYCWKVSRLLAVITRVNAERMILAWIILVGAIALLSFVILHQG